jgi:hypothetical protein
VDKEEEPRKIKTHEDLVIYQKAFNAAMTIFELSKQFPVEERYSLTDQIRRSSRSVCANFAEAWRKRRYQASPSVVRETGRQISCFLQGLLTIIADLLNGKGICLNGLFPFPPPFSESIAFNSS